MTMRTMSEAAIEALAEGRRGDPFALLGPHRRRSAGDPALLPGARAVTAMARSGETLAAFRRVHDRRGLFEAASRERPPTGSASTGTA